MLHYITSLPSSVVELIVICSTVGFMWLLTLLAWVPALTERLIRLLKALRQLWKK